MENEEKEVLKEIGKVLVKMQQELGKKEKKNAKDGLTPLTGIEELINQELKECITKIRNYINDEDLC